MIWALITGWIAKRGIMLGVIAAVTVAVAVWDHQRANRLRSEGANKVVQASKEKGRERNEQVRKIRDNIKRDGAWQRLQREYADRHGSE